MDNKNIGCGCNSSNNCSIESQKKGYIRAGISFILMMVGILLSVFNIAFFENKTVQFIWYVIAYIPVGLPVIIESYQAIKQKIFFSEFTLMCIATFGAFYIGEYPEAVAVMLFYAIGELFQDSAVNRAKKNISALIDVRPQIATIVINGKLKEVPPESVKVGNIIEVKVGQRVPLDGKMLNDYASFNTSALTGESVPRKIRKGENVLAGMILTDNVSRIEVTKPFGESALSRILDMVQNATEHKAPAEQFIRKFAKIYTPIVVILAILIVLLPFLLSLITPSFNYIFNDWLYRGLVFLVISCPCALVVSIPLSYFGGIGLASRNGILFKGSNYLEAITKVNTIVMDKTGTLTQGVFSVQKIAPTKDFSETELIHFISSIETQSSHPIAKAIVEYANKEKIELAKVSNVSEIAGYGLSGEIGNYKILVGNTRLLDLNNIKFPLELSNIPDTIIVCAINGIYTGYIIVADAPKEDAKNAIIELKRLGIKSLIMLSGDKQAIVSKIQNELGINEAYGDLLPEGKVEYVERLKLNPLNNIAFVGDGINDAPVLAMSDVSIAMGGLGSDVAIETADIVIQNDEPSCIARAIEIGKITKRIVWQNISLAFGIKLAVLILGAGGLATLWEAVFADVGVALLAILNAVRILKIK